MFRKSTYFWILLVILAIIFDFLFWHQSVGLNLTIYLLVCLSAGLYLLLSACIKPSILSIGLFVPILYFSVMTFIRSEPLSKFLAYFFTFLLLGVLATTYSGGHWYQYSFLDYFKNMFGLISSMFGEPVTFIKNTSGFKQINLQRTGFWIRSVLLGILIAFPILLCFSSLLVSADLVFQQKMSEFIRFLFSGTIFEYILRICIALFSASLMIGIYFHSASKSQQEFLTGDKQIAKRPILGFIESSVILGCVSVLFILFVLIQFRYLFGGNTNIGLEGYTFSEYARRGFNELIVVALMSLVLVIGLNAITLRNTTIQKRTHIFMSSLIIGLVMIILVSAYYRLNLGINWHGYSRLRLYPRVFMIWLGILLLTTIGLEVSHRERYFPLFVLLASLGFAGSICMVNIDAMIVHHNVDRVLQGKHFNVAHLTTLSLDAVVPLRDEFLDTSLPEPIHEGVGAALFCLLNSDRMPENPDNGWRSFNFSVWQAQKIKCEIQALLVDYYFSGEIDPNMVRTPHDRLFECQLIVR